ncbi:unnamed protein product [Porites lobata]|uniref:UMA domain-containing protein n=1 Tax=Porites lobata TaxID=104759 RepID=A0ABN8RE96_9CNID|nr:unnamed protein product [Porites lobata]
MSFLSGLYSKVVGANSKKTVQTCYNSASGTGFTEDFDSEDGFVLYTAEQKKRCKQTESVPGITNYRSYENLQQSCPYPPTGSPSYTITAAQKQVPQRRETTFLTVSDVPFQLSKQLQRVLQLNQGSLELSGRSPPNIEQYQYNFTLERDVLSSNEMASVG